MSELATVKTDDGFTLTTNAVSQSELEANHAPKPETKEPVKTVPEKAPETKQEPAQAAGKTDPKETPADPTKAAPEGTDDDEDATLKPYERRAKVQERIDRITRERRAAERKAEEVARERDELKARAEANAAELEKVRKELGVKAPDPDQRPKITDFDSVEAFETALETYFDQKKTKEVEIKAQEKATSEAKRERVEAFRERIYDVAASDPSLMEGLPDHLVNSVPLSALKQGEPWGLGNLIMEVLTKPQFKDPWTVLNFFKTPDGQTELQRLSTLHPMDVTLEIGMLYKGLSSATKTAPEEKPKPEISNAKPPGKAITGGPPSNLDPYEPGISVEEMDRRERALRQRR